ncbi:hypothetical protein CD178_03071 (plasmid) [Komagataeibacter saccharivorans]|uniref:Uncharacterized protein n=1 Tax=Komagataeibacter saccharivorans TaxID=265959 RepID=A0A347WG22_9PROT|nr:hypothetical protein CD178_03071 [Komagataeibacter saccharivorans]
MDKSFWVPLFFKRRHPRLLYFSNGIQGGPYPPYRCRVCQSGAS